MHRDYQNAGVNGCDSNLEQSYIRDAFKRNQQSDLPMLVIFELVGNDVCHGPNPGSMRSPAQFKSNMLALFNYLDTILPPGSKVMSVGLVNGSILWPANYNRTHPLGVTYEAFWDYLDCLGISYCSGWLTSNATAREVTTNQAMLLNQVYEEFVAENLTFNNFEWAYVNFPAEEVIKNWTESGGETWQLIEPVDGFHPNQIFHSMLADKFWEILSTNYSSWIGEINPNNAQIAQLFGDQGGY